ncbi:hypothetical protein PFISCL1PPCAC_6338 [Pristionchus fissidentatus]|uniref:Uncharacterized protein n=1 Tax=Pristionchus fissidentatus TaxID=1538716 RepID=A0AAV5V6N2_9BILA|nr:hypothetical protein PFISCL1PPCAC_6338 [Pristionchus fissidentatus]
MGERSSMVSHLKVVFEELRGVEELPHSVDDTLIDRLIDSIQSSEEGLADLIHSCFQDEELMEYGSVSLSILLRIAAKIVSENFMGETERKWICTVISTLTSLPSSSVQDAVMTLAIDLRRSGIEQWGDLTQWLLYRIPSDEISVFVRRKAIDFLKMEKVDNVITKLIRLSIDNLDSAPSLFVLESYCTLMSHFHKNLREGDGERIWQSAKKCSRLPQSFVDLLTVIGENSFSSHLSNAFEWTSSAGRMKVMIAIARKCKDRSIVDAILESEEASIDLLDNLMLSVGEEEVLKLFSSIPQTSRFSASSFTSFLTQLISRFPPSSLHSFYEFYLPRVMRDPSPFVKTLPLIDNWTTVLVDLHSDLLSRIESSLESNEWETRDSSLELLRVFPSVPSSLHSTLLSLISSDPSPYVRSLSLHLLSLSNPPILDDSIEEVVLKDDDHVVRLEGVEIILEMKWREKMERLIPTILMDEDREIRVIGLKMIREMMGDEEKEWKWRQELMRWREDSDIGREVREMIGEKKEEKEKGEDLMETLIASLSLHSEDIDCY